MAKLTKFQDFKNKEEEKELQDLKRTYTKNTVDTQQFPRNTKYNFNYKTRKMDDLSIDEVEDKIEELEDVKEAFSKPFSINLQKDVIDMLENLKTVDRVIDGTVFSDYGQFNLAEVISFLSNTILQLKDKTEDYVLDRSRTGY
jgi:hypothetical protein